MSSNPATMANYSFVTRECCPLCASDAEEMVSIGFGEEPMAGFLAFRYDQDPAEIAQASYVLDRCKNCTFLFQREIGGPEFMEELYTNWVENPADPMDMSTYRRDLEKPFESRDAHELMAASSYLGLPLERMRTLDYGMGWGLWARIARIVGAESWGSEIAQDRIAFCADQGIKIATDEQIGSLRFHFINLDQVLEHLPDPWALTERLAKSLAPGGILKISVPSAEAVDEGRVLDWLEKREADVIMPVHPLEHVNGFTKTALEVLAQRLGLTPVLPSLWHRYAFVRARKSLSPSRPKQAVKELVRPLVQHRMPSNLYVWLRAG